MSTSLAEYPNRQNSAEQSFVVRQPLNDMIGQAYLNRILGKNIDDEKTTINKTFETEYAQQMGWGPHVAELERKNHIGSALDTDRPVESSDYQYGVEHFTDISKTAAAEGSKDESSAALRHASYCLQGLAYTEGWSKQKLHRKQASLERLVKKTAPLDETAKRPNIAQRAYISTTMLGTAALLKVDEKTSSFEKRYVAADENPRGHKALLIGSLGAGALVVIGVGGVVAAQHGYYHDIMQDIHGHGSPVPVSGSGSTEHLATSATHAAPSHVAASPIIPGHHAPHPVHAELSHHAIQSKDFNKEVATHTINHTAGNDLYSGDDANATLTNNHVNLDDGKGSESLTYYGDNIWNHFAIRLGRHASNAKILKAVRRYDKVHHLSSWMTRHLPVGWKFTLPQ